MFQNCFEALRAIVLEKIHCKLLFNHSKKIGEMRHTHFV